MDTKLTLRLNSFAIEKAKSYSKKKHTSLSALVEKFFISLNEEPITNNQDKNLSPIVSELSGIIDAEMKSEIKDLKKQRLIKKY